jgi:hypothetical protein
MRIRRGIVVVAAVILLWSPGCAPITVQDEPGRVAYTADQIVLRVIEIQNGIIVGQQRGVIPTAAARTLVTFTVGTLETLKASPGGWKPMVHAAWNAIRPELQKVPEVAPWIISIDMVIGYIVGEVV